MIKVLYAVVAAIALLSAGCGRTSTAPVKIYLTMRNTRYGPLKKGKPVEFVISTEDVQHGF